jgi:hypothetical protein
VLQLHKTEGGQDYAEFLHAPRKRFTDFGNIYTNLYSLKYFFWQTEKIMSQFVMVIVCC